MIIDVRAEDRIDPKDAPGTSGPTTGPRPRHGEPVDSYIQRLARANYLKPQALRTFLRPPPRHTGAIDKGESRESDQSASLPVSVALCRQGRVDDHEAVNTDYWAVLADSDREQWGFVPRRTVGPLNFGVDRHEAVTIMAGHGFVAEECEIERWNPQRAQWRVEFRRAESDEHQPAVKCYFIEGVGLTCVFVDGLRGPQVTCEGIRLIGRVPSELDAELETCAVERDLSCWYCPTGYVCWADFSFERGAQIAGDTLLSWASFGNPGELAHSSWDMAPAEVRHHGWSAWD
ncbi:hypothetical protein [Streptomyces sp. LN245]|uniref:hypothetical protein n=1 Tax=Streptomyces sp. LN245 TaxID=3112975 RepID=UPI003710B25A